MYPLQLWLSFIMLTRVDWYYNLVFPLISSNLDSDRSLAALGTFGMKYHTITNLQSPHSGSFGRLKSVELWTQLWTLSMRWAVSKHRESDFNWKLNCTLVEPYKEGGTQGFIRAVVTFYTSKVKKEDLKKGEGIARGWTCLRGSSIWPLKLENFD